jgi:hypothetical protein
MRKDKKRNPVPRWEFFKKRRRDPDRLTRFIIDLSILFDSFPLFIRLPRSLGATDPIVPDSFPEFR